MVLYLKKYIETRRNKTLPQDIQLRFLQRLYRLLTNGYPLLEALEVIMWDKELASTSREIMTSLKNGHPLDLAFEKARFHQTITSYLYFVRNGGDLQSSIEKCINMYEHRLKYMKQFKQIIRYPLILLFFFSLLLYFIKRSVLPSFVELFQINSDASATVVLLIMIIEFLGILLFVFLIMIVIGLVLWELNKRKISIERQIKVYCSIPIYRNFIRLQTSFLFATHISTMLKTGMPIKDVLANLSEQKKLPIISYYSSLMIMELSNGLHLVNLLSRLDLLEQELAIIFQKNVDVHALEKDLEVYAEMLTDELQRKVMKTITYIQPVFFIVLASFIIFIYITLMWPMFELIKTI